MPRVIAGVALGSLWVAVWSVVLTLLGGDLAALPGCLAVFLIPGLLGGPAGALLDPARLERLPLGAVIGFVLVALVTWPVAFWAFRFLLTTSFDLLDEVAAVFATLVLGAVVATLLGAFGVSRVLARPAGRAGAIPPLVLASLGVILVSRVTSRILGFELITVGMVAGSTALAVPALHLLLPAGFVRRRGAMVTAAGLSVLLLAGCLGLYTASGTIRLATWSSIPAAHRLAAALAQLTDADADGVSGVLGHPDCQEFDSNQFPGNYEIPGDGRDDNCAGGDPSVADVAALWHPPDGPRAPGPPSAPTFARRHYNVVLITLDAVRADHLSTYGYERQTSRNLTHLAELSLTFEAAWSASNFTALSLYSLFTGVYPSSFLEIESIVSRGGVLLPETLRAAGYRAEAIVDLGEPLHHVFVGFDAVDQTLGVRAREAVRNRSTGSTARDLTTLASAAAARLGAGDAPFFLWVHYSEPHAEYLAHAGYDMGSSDLDRYDAEIAFADAWIGHLLASLRGDGRLEDTIIVVTADHGEAFREHGVQTHGQTLYEEELHVPLIIYLPSPDGRGFRSARVPSPLDLTDVAPTLLDAVGVAAGGPMHGESLLPHALDGRPLRTPEAFAETRLPFARLQAWRLGSEKIIADHLVGATRRFDLATDPGELRGAPIGPEALARWTDLHLAYPRLGGRGLQALPPPDDRRGGPVPAAPLE